MEYSGPINAPISKDQVLGKLKIYYKDELMKIKSENDYNIFYLYNSISQFLFQDGLYF